MQKVNISICVCAECMLSGAMDIIASIESLKKMPKASSFSFKIIPTTPHFSENHTDIAPLVTINGESMQNVTTQNVMAKILSLSNDA